MNEGDFGGRACWVIAGTLCGGSVQGTFATKLTTCIECDFYALVRKEQGQAWVPAKTIIEIIENPRKTTRAGPPRG